MTCPKCGKENTPFMPVQKYQEFVLIEWWCQDCGHVWRVLCRGEKDELGITFTPV